MAGEVILADLKSGVLEDIPGEVEVRKEESVCSRLDV